MLSACFAILVNQTLQAFQCIHVTVYSKYYVTVIHQRLRYCISWTFANLVLCRMYFYFLDNWTITCASSISRGCPQLAHLIRTRFLADPPWACLPRPRLEWHNEAVVLRPRESTDVGVANLAGFVLVTWCKVFFLGSFWRCNRCKSFKMGMISNKGLETECC